MSSNAGLLVRHHRDCVSFSAQHPWLYTGNGGVAVFRRSRLAGTYVGFTFYDDGRRCSSFEGQVLLPIFVGPACCVGLVFPSPMARYEPSRKRETSTGDHRGISWFDLVLSDNQFRILDDGHHVSSHARGTAHLLYRCNSFLPTRVGR